MNDTKSSSAQVDEEKLSISSLSEYSTSDEQSTGRSLSQNDAHEYAVCYGKWHANLIFSTDPESKNPLYFAEVSQFTPDKPDITIHDVQGREKEDVNAPILGITHFRWSRDLKLGLGDPVSDPSGMIWEDMKNEKKIKHTKYRFSFTSTQSQGFSAPFSHDIAPATAAASDGHRGSYSWQFTKDAADGVDPSWGGKLARWNFKLVEEGSGQKVAVFLGTGLKSWKKAGKIRIRDGLDKRLEVMIVLTITALMEKRRRRMQKIAVSAGAASGGN